MLLLQEQLGWGEVAWQQWQVWVEGCQWGAQRQRALGEGEGEGLVGCDPVLSKGAWGLLDTEDESESKSLVDTLLNYAVRPGGTDVQAADD